MRDQTTNEARVRLGELAASLDDQLTLTLALHYGREFVHVLTLVNDVLWRVPADARVRQLEEALKRTGLQAEVPAPHCLADRGVLDQKPPRAQHCVPGG